MNTEYGIGISFNTNRKLSHDELDQLINAVAVQIEDPSGLNGDKRAAFTVSNLAYDIWANNSTIVRILADGTQFMGDK
jgi:hypothetical protein